MNIKILFIFLVLLLLAKSFTKEHLSKDFLAEASGGMLQKKSDSSVMDTSLNVDPTSATFDSDLNKFIQEKSGDERAVVVDGDVSGLEVNEPAKVEQEIGKDLKEDEEGSGCSDTLVFGLILLLVIYTVYFKIKKLNFNLYNDLL